MAKNKQKDVKSTSIISINGSDYSYSAAPALDYVGLMHDDIYNCFMPPINRHALAKLPHQNA
ncbi:phage portal protein, partial [Pasteurella multocida P1933]